MHSMSHWMIHFLFQLTRLQIENDSLVGKHSKLAQEMQDENINLPDNMEVNIVLLTCHPLEHKGLMCLMVYLNSF